MEARISMPDVKITDKELIHMVSHGVVVKPDGTKVTMEDLEKVGIVPKKRAGRGVKDDGRRDV